MVNTLSATLEVLGSIPEVGLIILFTNESNT